MRDTERRFHALAPAADLHDGYRRVFQIKGIDLLLLQHEGKPYLLDNTCPHAGYPMHEGRIIDDQLRCPMHGYLFRLADGACTLSPEGPCRDADTYPLSTEDGHIGVYL